jgi:hypothetical protein
MLFEGAHFNNISIRLPLEFINCCKVMYDIVMIVSQIGRRLAQDIL